MGNCCSRFLPPPLRDFTTNLKDNLENETNNFQTNVDSPSNTLSYQIHCPGIPQAMSQNSPSAFAGQTELILKNMLPLQVVVSLQNMFFDQINLHQPTLQLIKSGNFPCFSDAATFAENVSKESGFEVINVLMQTYKSQFRGDFELFTYLNQVVSLLPSLDEYELVHLEPYQDTIFMIERVRTQRILVIASRHLLALRIIRRLPGGRLLDISQSVEYNDLLTFPTLKQMYEEKVKNESAAVIISGRYFEEKEGWCQVTTFSKVDFHSSIPLKFAAIFLRSTFDDFFAKLAENCQIHLADDVWNSGREIIWFRDEDKNELIVPEFVANKNKAKL